MVSMLCCLCTDRELSMETIQDEWEKEPWQYKMPIIRSRSQKIEEQISSRLMMIEEVENPQNIKIIAYSSLLA